MLESAHHALVLDIGGSHVSAAVVNLETRSIVNPSESRASVNPNASAETLLEAWSVNALKSHALAGRPSIAHLGIAMPGPFEYATGISRLEHKFAALYGVDVGAALKSALEAQLGTISVFFGNDATLFALGEWWAGAARGHARVFGVTLGTGLGGGFVVGGLPCYSGDGLPPNGAIWNLPYQGGIAEDAVSGQAVSRAYQKHTGQPLSAVQIAQAARQGDSAAQAAFLEIGAHLGRILKPWIISFQPGCLVVGGNLARAWKLFCQPLTAELHDQALEVRASRLFDSANLFGAAALGVQR
jgi:glucokinase